LFIENKLQYLLPVHQPQDTPELEVRADIAAGIEFDTPTYIVNVKGAPAAQVTLTAYGYMAELARQALLRLAYEEEIFAELIVPTRLVPFDAKFLSESIRRTGRLVTIEEGNLTGGWGAEILARVMEKSNGVLRAAARVAARDLPVAAAPALESAILPGVDDILRIVRKVVGRDE